MWGRAKAKLNYYAAILLLSSSYVEQLLVIPRFQVEGEERKQNYITML